jgi:hypothetical protein
MLEAVAVSREASALVWSTELFVEIVGYHFYSALALAVVSEELSE